MARRSRLRKPPHFMTVQNPSPYSCLWRCYGAGVIARAHMEGRRGKYFDVRWPLVKDAELRSALCTGSRDQGLIAVDA